MFKMSYCWKCEEIKDRHNLLNKMLPDDVCILLGKYDTCKICKRNIHYYERCFNENESKVSQILLHMRYHNSDIETNIHNTHYNYIIKRSSHPHKKS